ncbi:hypothetical protein Tco_1206556, partial [Tanacetum coccineum]
RYPWLDILRESTSLINKGINLFAPIRKKVENGEDTLFWEETVRKRAKGGDEDEQFWHLQFFLADLILPQMNDRWYWSLNGSGEFSVNSARILIDDTLLSMEDVPTRWVKLVLKFHLFFFPILNASVESSSHLLFSCPFAHQVRSKVFRWWGLDDHDFSSYDAWLLWLKSIHMSSSLKVVFEGVCYVMWWAIWRFGNRLLFYKSPPREWDASNINTIVKVLKCFFMASGLKVNIQKSKLMGLGVHLDEVDSTARLIGCSTFSTPFIYLGVKVGGAMSKLSSWDEVTSKVYSRLFKWKLNTLSIGGRPTLLKSVLSSILLYHMSIFKVPMGVLNHLELIHMNCAQSWDGTMDSYRFLRLNAKFCDISCFFKCI